MDARRKEATTKADKRNIKGEKRELKRDLKNIRKGRKAYIDEETKRFRRDLKERNSNDPDQKAKKRHSVAYIASSYLTLGLVNSTIDELKKISEAYNTKYDRFSSRTSVEEETGRNNEATAKKEAILDETKLKLGFAVGAKEELKDISEEQAGAAKKIIHDVTLAEAKIVTTIQEAKARGEELDREDLREKLKEIFERNTSKDAIRNLVVQRMGQNNNLLEPKDVKTLLKEFGVNPGKDFEKTFKSSGAKSAEEISNFIHTSIHQNRRDRTGLSSSSIVLEQAEVLRDANDLMQKTFGKKLYGNISELIDTIVTL